MSERVQRLAKAFDCWRGRILRDGFVHFEHEGGVGKSGRVPVKFAPYRSACSCHLLAGACGEQRLFAPVSRAACGHQYKRQPHSMSAYRQVCSPPGDRPIRTMSRASGDWQWRGSGRSGRYVIVGMPSPARTRFGRGSPCQKAGTTIGIIGACRTAFSCGSPNHEARHAGLDPASRFLRR
ncbi:hypothetical protein WR25_13629 [Diploscapter pachys]|uniref:Uncharacterized protein n=1 Tax=Diploscapter pachys TaxID=2018661 RepID=A0A2A2M2Z9_9BILA|nr:hypothetical protein WR25_13629 [Diploscapter pachys]